MKKHIILIILISLLIGNSQNQKQHTKVPNVVIIFIDDEGYGDVGSYGATGFETPNIDEIAAKGMKFTNYYAAQPVCSASRAGLLTGCYPNRIGFAGVLRPNDTRKLDFFTRYSIHSIWKAYQY